MSIVHAWTGKRSEQPRIMALLRHLFLVAANNDFTVSLKHVPGIKNIIADAISRSLAYFSCSTGHPSPTVTLGILNAQLRDILRPSHAGSIRAVYHIGIKHFLSFYFAVSLSRSLAPSTISHQCSWRYPQATWPG